MMGTSSPKILLATIVFPTPGGPKKKMTGRLDKARGSGLEPKNSEYVPEIKEGEALRRIVWLYKSDKFSYK
jgi:hypothetical protein